MVEKAITERGLLVHVTLTQAKYHTRNKLEFFDLASSAGLEIVDSITVNYTQPDPKYFIGSGKVNELTAMIKQQQIALVVFNQNLTPAQERNLERTLEARVLDRTGLILDIFAQRAHSFEGKLQVELAQLEHLRTRLVRGWTHLERQKGGIGLRGPGETQLEVDRRLIRKRIKVLKHRLATVANQRQHRRQARQNKPVPNISLVGYTNAGKSTLFNVMTQADVFADPQLFATLDPTLRQLTLPYLNEVVLADTVGFVQDLPHDLVAAFRATLEEARDADLLLHVIDYADPDHHEKIIQVNTVLDEIGAGKVPQLRVYNKIDQLEHSLPCVRYDETQTPQAVLVSAVQRQGIDLLLQAISDCLTKDFINCNVIIPAKDAKLRAQLYALRAVENETGLDSGDHNLQLKLSKKFYQRLQLDRYRIIEDKNS